jgi:hypothetical protein
VFSPFLQDNKGTLFPGIKDLYQGRKCKNIFPIDFRNEKSYTEVHGEGTEVHRALKGQHFNNCGRSPRQAMPNNTQPRSGLNISVTVQPLRGCGFPVVHYVD